MADQGLQDLLNKINDLSPEAQQRVNNSLGLNPGYSVRSQPTDNPVVPQAAPEVEDQDDDKDVAEEDHSAPKQIMAQQKPAARQRDVADDSQDDDDTDSDDSDDQQSPQQPVAQAQPQDPLAAALADRDKRLKDAQVQRGFEQLSGGIARLNPNTSESDLLTKQAEMPVNDFKLKQANEENDPRSGMSSTMRDYLTQQGIKVPPNATAAQLRQVAPYYFKDLEAKQAQAARAEAQQNQLAQRAEQAKEHNDMMKLHYAEMAQRQKEATGDKQGKQDTERLDKLNKSITSDVASGRSAFGLAARNYQSIDNAQALLNGTIDPNQLDNRQVYELSKSLDRVLSGGNGGTVSGSEHLTPDTARGYLSKLMEYVTNKRTGAGAGSFIESMAHTFDREKQQAMNQMARTQKELLGSSRDLMQRHPDEFNNILDSHTIPHDIMNFKPTTEAGAHADSAAMNASQAEITPDVAQYAQTHNMTPQQALALKKLRTQGK